jgi:hypothetical protein
MARGRGLGLSHGYARAQVLARHLLYILAMQHTGRARHGGRSRARHAARSFSLIATVAFSLGLPGLARAQAPGEVAPQAAPDTRAMPDAPAAQAPAASPGALHAPAGMQAPDADAPATAQPMASMTVSVDEKHAGFALGGALVTTGLGIGAMIAGISSDNGALGLAGFTATLLGPSFGHFYAGEIGRGLTQTGVRAGAAIMTVGGMAWALVGFFDCVDFSGEDSDCSPLHLGAPLLIAGGLGLGAGSIIQSIHDAPRAAGRYNARARARRLQITAVPVTGPDHSTGLGLQLGGQF